MDTQVINCTDCKAHEYQDKVYGRNMRVCNPMKKPEKGGTIKYRCTVCGKEHEGR